MIFVPRDADEHQVLDIVHEWIDVIAAENYETVFAELGYSLAFGRPGGECVREAIESYRSPQYYPGVEEFVVTDWRKAQGGNRAPAKIVTWYKPNSTGLSGAVAFDLPINGKWSDLTANFVFFENENMAEGYVLSLEDVQSNGQWQQA